MKKTKPLLLIFSLMFFNLISISIAFIPEKKYWRYSAIDPIGDTYAFKSSSLETAFGDSPPLKENMTNTFNVISGWMSEGNETTSEEKEKDVDVSNIALDVDQDSFLMDLSIKVTKFPVEHYIHGLILRVAHGGEIMEILRGFQWYNRSMTIITHFYLYDDESYEIFDSSLSERMLENIKIENYLGEIIEFPIDLDFSQPITNTTETLPLDLLFYSGNESAGVKEHFYIDLFQGNLTLEKNGETNLTSFDFLKDFWMASWFVLLGIILVGVILVLTNRMRISKPKGKKPSRRKRSK